MATSISGSSGVTFPAGGTGNPAGAVVGTTDAQTLTNKTLTSPTITGAVVSTMASSVITSGTAVASTSGTSIDFTSIPSWVKRITVMFNDVSTNGTSNWQIQLGDSGGIETTSYSSAVSRIGASGATNSTATSGFLIHNSIVAAGTFLATAQITLLDASSNTWSCFGTSNSSSTANSGCLFNGSKALSATLDRVRITTVNGTDTFDAGSINILYE